jgi:hypothetical protein
MNPLELVSMAMRQMEELRKAVESAAGGVWQKNCRHELAKVSGLDLAFAPKCAVNIYATCKIKALPPSIPPAVLEMAKTIAAAGGDPTEQTEKLVDYWLQQFPETCLPTPEPDCSLFNVLGLYIPKNKSAPRAEIYWIKIAQYLRRNPRPVASLADVSKVIMLHELAHYVTHHGRADGKDWCSFEGETTEAVEFAAQVGCEQVIKAGRFKAMEDAFNELCDGPPKQLHPYRVHRSVVPELDRLEKLWAVQAKAADDLHLTPRQEAATDDEWGLKASAMGMASSIGRNFQDPLNLKLHCVWLFVRHILRPRWDRLKLSVKTMQLEKDIEELSIHIKLAPKSQEARNIISKNDHSGWNL